MKKRTKQCIGAFLITVILIGALCGFVAVDLSTDRYMPGQFGPLFQVSTLGADGLSFSYMGKDYLLMAQPFAQLRQAVEPYRGLLPQHLRIAAALAAEGYRYLTGEGQATE